MRSAGKKHLLQFVLLAFFSVVASVTFTSSHAITKTVESLKIDTGLLVTGDIIFRKGISLVSRMVLLADGTSPYSHTGIIYRNGDSLLVIHSVPAENKDENDIVKAETIEEFLLIDRAEAVAVYRLKEEFTEEKILTLSQFILFHSSNSTPFDDSFDLENDEKLYCTELIWKAYLQAGIDLIDSKFDNLNLPIVKGDQILPGSILKSKYLKQLLTSTK